MFTRARGHRLGGGLDLDEFHPVEPGRVGLRDTQELVEIKATTQPVTPGAREQRRLYEFSLRVSIKPPGVAVAAPGGVAAGAASGPGRAASAPINRQPA